MIALQFNPPIFCVTPKGDGRALAMIDYGPDMNTVFLVEHDETREWLTIDLLDMRGSGNPMWGLAHPDPPEPRA